MIQEHVKSVAKFVRDLLSYDTSLVKFDRTGTQQEDVNTSYIVVNSSGVSTVKSTGKTYDGVAEVMNYNSTISQPFTIEFYGDDAYTNSDKFLLLSNSQKANELRRALGITTYNVRQATDVKQILGSQYGNRVHVEFNVTYTPNTNIETLRVDEAVFEFLED